MPYLNSKLPLVAPSDNISPSLNPPSMKKNVLTVVTSSILLRHTKELKRPLGVVLEEDEKGNVYVETVAPLGNAARTGVVKKGDIVVMCSATFGDQLWSTRGCGLPRVLSAIKVRAGPTVTLVLEVRLFFFGGFGGNSDMGAF